MIYFIRHAESVSNAGGKTGNVKEIPLSEKGFQQSLDLLKKICIKPDLIIVSPYLRAQQTADLFIKKYPDVPVELWDVQEFTFLDADRCNHTTQDERLVIREEYITKNNPDLVHGKGAESFNQMLQRVDDMFDKLIKIDESKIVFVFTHGMFMRAALARYDRKNVTFNDVFKGITINNTDIIALATHDF